MADKANTDRSFFMGRVGAVCETVNITHQMWDIVLYICVWKSLIQVIPKPGLTMINSSVSPKQPTLVYKMIQIFRISWKYSEFPLLVKHNDGSWEASDWLMRLQWAQKTACDWVVFVLVSFLRLAVATQQEARVSLNVEGAMLMSVFVSNGTFSMVKGLRLKDGNPWRWFPNRYEKRGPGWNGTERAWRALGLGHWAAGSKQMKLMLVSLVAR